MHSEAYNVRNAANAETFPLSWADPQRKETQRSEWMINLNSRRKFTCDIDQTDKSLGLPPLCLSFNLLTPPAPAMPWHIVCNKLQLGKNMDFLPEGRWGITVPACLAALDTSSQVLS